MTAVLAVILCAALASTPAPVRRQLHTCLRGTVARAPLMLQPLILLFPQVSPSRRQCRLVGMRGGRAHLKQLSVTSLQRLLHDFEFRLQVASSSSCCCCCRDAVVLGLHCAVFALQYYAVLFRGSNWLDASGLLTNPSVGLWLLVAMFGLQVSPPGPLSPLLFGLSSTVGWHNGSTVPASRCLPLQLPPHIPVPYPLPRLLLQLCVACQMPGLVLLYAASAVLLPSTCPSRADDTIVALPICLVMRCVLRPACSSVRGAVADACATSSLLLLRRRLPTR